MLFKSAPTTVLSFHFFLVLKPNEALDLIVNLLKRTHFGL